MIGRSVGIYAAKNTLQFVILGKGIGRPRLLAAESVKIPQAQAEAAVVLKSILRKHGIKDGQMVSAAIPPESVVIRYFQMPRLPLQEHKTAVPFEARKYLPYKLEDITYAYTVSYDKVSSNKMAVTFVAADKAFVANYIRFFEGLGLRVCFLEAVPHSLMRFLYQAKGVQAVQTAALIYAAEESASINIIRNKVLYLTRNLSFSGKLSQAAGNPDAKFENLLSEIRLSFDYFHRQFPEEKIEEMVVWTLDKRIQEGVEQAGKDFNMHTSASNPFDIIEKGQGFSLEYAICAALALRPFCNQSQDINLSPGFKKIEIEKLAKLAVVELCLAALALAVFSAADSGRVRGLEKELKTQSINISKKGTESQKRQAQEKLNYLQRLAQGRFSVSSKIDRLSSFLQKTMWVSEINYGKPKSKRPVLAKNVFVIKGYALRAEGDRQIKDINMFLENLKQDKAFSAGFSDIKLESILNEKFHGLDVTSFNISCATE